jgi:hypothetical protein
MSEDGDKEGWTFIEEESDLFFSVGEFAFPG